MTAPLKIRRYDAERQRRKRAEQRAVREASSARQVEQAVRDANVRRQPEVRVVRLRDGRVFALGFMAGTDQPHPFVPDKHTATSCQLCFGWSNDYRHVARQRAVLP